MPSKQTVNRASQFLAFDALKGFRTYLKQKERVVVQRKVLMEDHLIQLDRKIHKVTKGMMLQVVYYDKDEYVQVEGIVANIDIEYKRYIQIVNTRIPLKDIYEISFV